MSHRYHPDQLVGDPPKALLWDDCERCDEQATDPRGLDHGKLAEAWLMMLTVELHAAPDRGPDSRRYRTGAERKLGDTLYRVYVIVERLGALAGTAVTSETTHQLHELFKAANERST